VPLVAGGQWASGEQLAGVVQDDTRSPGIYLTLDPDLPGGVDAWTWPSDPQGLGEAPYYASDAAQAADFSLSQAPVWQTFLKTIQLIDSGQGATALQAEMTAAAQGGGQAAAGQSSDAGAITTGVLAFGAAGTAALVVLGRRRRRRRTRSALRDAPPVFSLPATVAVAARAASEGELRAEAQQALLALGGLLEQCGPGDAAADGAPGARSGPADADLSRAIDCYDAAARVFDSAAGRPDLAGVLVLAHMGNCAAGAAQARQAGDPEPPANWLCFFNPVHGEGTQQVRLLARGGQQAVDVHACRPCAGAVARGKSPDILTASSGKREVPYYGVVSAWAATGYGQFSSGDDLVERILTAGAHPARG
jgi:hypothetical protein